VGLEIQGRTKNAVALDPGNEPARGEKRGASLTDIHPPNGLLGRLLPGIIWGLTAGTPSYAVDEAIDSAMYSDPEVPAARVVKVFPARLTALWLQALDRPESELKCHAAATIALVHRRGMKGLEATVAPLMRTLDEPDQHPTVRLASARALIALDARQAADSLFRHAQTDGVEMRQLVEPALARWDYGPMRAVWLERLHQPGEPDRKWLLALQGLGVVHEPRAVPRLRELALAPLADPIVRLEAARALGTIQTAGFEKDAERLAAEKNGVANLAAASLLRKHRGGEAAKLLERLAVGSNPAAAAVALQALLEDDPRRIMPLMTQVITSSDAAVRLGGVEAHRLCPLAEHIALVAELLDDPHPQVRISARKALVETAQRAGQDEAVVRREATRLLASQRWRALEQAAILLTVLDHKPAAARLVELLQFERPEVFVTAAWGLRKLAIPETLPSQLREIERRWQQSLGPEAMPARPMIDLQVAQLAQSLGQARYAPAGPILTRFVPKQFNIGRECRAAAIWALGRIHEEHPSAPLIRALIERLTDESRFVVEDLGVRRMSAIALGRMKAEEAVDSLKHYYPGKLSVDPFPNACGWALEQITGEQLPTSGTADVIQRGWFLEPNDS
jgi:HEAT repeat protein